MMLLLSLVLAAQFFSFVSTSPLQVIPNRPDIATLSKKDVSSQWNAVDLNNEFKGIWWTEALSGGLDCTPEQIDKLVYATRAAMWMLQSPMEDPMSWFESIAFGRYFGRYSSWLNSGSEYLNASTAIFHNVQQAAKYPVNGKKGQVIQKKGKRAIYTCNIEVFPQGREKCTNGETAATTGNATVSKLEAWTILFCPLFFESKTMKYLEEVTKQTSEDMRKPANVGKLDTYERAIIHEYMHVDMFKFREHIADVEATLSENSDTVMPVYGEIRARMFAAKYAHHPNFAVIKNADNYAWFFTYYYFAKQWDWRGPPKHDELKKAGDVVDDEKELTEADLPIVIPEPDFPVNEKDVHVSTEMPANCRLTEEKDIQGNKIIQCDYVDGDDDEEVAEPSIPTPMVPTPSAAPAPPEVPKASPSPQPTPKKKCEWWNIICWIGF